MKVENYSLGLDIGIGSIGWAVLDNDMKRIVDFGVRLFESGENERDKDRDSQKRRAYRGQRRNIRRRHHRKERLKHLLNKYNIITSDSLDKWYKNGNAVYEKICELNLCEKFTTRDFYPLRAMALDYKLSGEELAAVLIHICNHRGYNPFYEDDEDSEGKVLKEYSTNLEKILKDGNYRTVGEMYALDDAFKNPNEDFKNYGFIYNANKKDSRFKKEEYHLVLRSQTKEEAQLILNKQMEFYPVLKQEIEVMNQGNIEKTTLADRIMDIIFSQRDFEDGPSYDEKTSSQKYHGLTMDSVGYCMYYPNEKRGVRASLLGDLYATTNLLSQYTYFNTDTGEIGIEPDAAKELVSRFINDGELTNAAMKKVLKKYNLDVNTKTGSKDTFSKCNKFTKEIKSICEKSGISWEEITKGDQLSTKTPINKLAEILAFNVTPKRRKAALRKINFINDDFINSVGKNYGGTSNVSDKFMIESIEAFMNGEIYGDFQARKLEERFNENKQTTDLPIKLPMIKDIDMIKNPVVFRSLNETRKVVNAIIEKYGSPSSINVEVASDLNRSFTERSKIAKSMRDNEKNNDNYRHEIAEITGQSVNSVTLKEIEKYKLYEQQEGRCLYSGQKIDEVKEIFTEKYEIDHIIPYSLILDNTLANKCLVLRTENQKKKQRTPLQYFREENMSEKEAAFIARVNVMFKNSKNDALKKKYQYLMTPDIYQEKLFDQWKSRNINDTRYIAKYAVNMLSGIQIKNKGLVLPIKGGITSKFRRWWLVNPKSELEPYSYIQEFLQNHAKALRDLDNIINGTKEKEEENKTNENENNDTPKTKEEAQTSKQQIYQSCINDMKKNYGFDEEYTQKLLENNLLEKNREETNLHHAVDAIILAALSKKYIELALDSNKLYEIWREERSIREKYADYIQRFREKKDGIVNSYTEYLESCKRKMLRYYHMSEYETEKYLLNPYKIPGKFEKLKDEVLVRTIDHNEELFYTLTHKLYESEFADGLSMPLVSVKQERKFTGAYTTDNAEKSKNQSNVTSVKTISENNYSVLTTNKYYCTEIYKNEKDETCMRGIRRIDIIKKCGKLYLKCKNPDGYKQHIMYLFNGDYIELFNGKGILKFSGFFKWSTVTVNKQQIIHGIYKNNPYISNKTYTLSYNGYIKKYNVDILGKRGGEIKCGEPLSLIMPKESV